eukprot:3834643-Amphidinium_carterae.1
MGASKTKTTHDTFFKSCSMSAYGGHCNATNLGMMWSQKPQLQRVTEALADGGGSVVVKRPRDLTSDTIF